MIEIRIYYTGKEGKAKEFANDMIASKVVDRIRSEEGNLEYSYFIPLGSKFTVRFVGKPRGYRQAPRFAYDG